MRRRKSRSRISAILWSADTELRCSWAWKHDAIGIVDPVGLAEDRVGDLPLQSNDIFAKYVGYEVQVTGAKSPGPKATLTVTGIVQIADTCGQSKGPVRRGVKGR